MPTLIQQIFTTKDRYHKLAEIIDSGEGASCFGELVAIRKELSCLALDLGLVTGDSIKERNRASSQREITQYLKQRELMASGVKVTAAEAQAKQSVTDYMKNESEAEGDYMSNKIILAQTNAVIDSIKQDIAIIRKEYETISDR